MGLKHSRNKVKHLHAVTAVSQLDNQVLSKEATQNALRGKMRANKIMNMTRAVSIAGVLMLPLFALASSSLMVPIPITITVPQITCDLSFNGQKSLTYPLNSLLRGTTKQHSPFTVNVMCLGEGTVKTAIKAKILSGGQLEGNNDIVRVRMVTEGVQTTDNNAPRLWLETDAGQRVKLTGNDSDVVCSKEDTSPSAQNVCQLRPVTDVPDDSPLGKFEVTLRLDVAYIQ